MRSSPCWAPVVTKTSSCLAGVPSAAITSTMTSFTGSSPEVGPYCSAWAVSAAMLPESSRVREAPGERDDAGPREGRHEVAGGRGLHALDPLGVEEVEAVEVYERHLDTPLAHEGLDVLPAQALGENLPELGGHLEAAGAAASPPHREDLEVVVTGGEGILACYGPDSVCLLDEVVSVEPRPYLRRQPRTDHRREVVAGGHGEEPPRAEHQVVLEPQLAHPDPL